MIFFSFSLFIAGIPNIPVHATWNQNGEIVAGGNGSGNATNELWSPFGLYIDDDQTIVIADHDNNRIIQRKMGHTDARIVAGGNGEGNGPNQLHNPTDVLIAKQTDSLIICDRSNRRVVQWSRCNGTTQGKILIGNISCYGLATDDQRYLYVSDTKKHEVIRYQITNENGTLVADGNGTVAGGNGSGAGPNQLNTPAFIFVDQEQTIYVSDRGNRRVMKCNKDVKQEIFVPEDEDNENALTKLSNPQGLFVDTLGTIYVADEGNHKVMRWSNGTKQVTVIVSGNAKEEEEHQLKRPMGLSFDRDGNLYVVDGGSNGTNSVKRFDIEKTHCQ
ncbi:unnamed protein product [Rotaria sp. Silwood2]|nr:unnamed protein product [Rotaria sp. Silwood2]CAF3051701.1 unnamed protein product [Rotaria sp. Silwood2]CAF4268706.1 unnamed protein product [Rotaria sp. Silwood2]CAF4473221.1 unnamed protein product [Rotaria sp. Silwood2]